MTTLSTLRWDFTALTNKHDHVIRATAAGPSTATFPLLERQIQYFASFSDSRLDRRKYFRLFLSFCRSYFIPNQLADAPGPYYSTLSSAHCRRADPNFQLHNPTTILMDTFMCLWYSCVSGGPDSRCSNVQLRFGIPRGETTSIYGRSNQ